MKKGQSSLITKVKSGKVVKQKVGLRARSSWKHRRTLPQIAGPKYSDALIQIYNQEEEDINRFAAFAKTLVPNQSK